MASSSSSPAIHMAGRRDWSLLLPELLHVISDSLSDISDRHHFRSVCSTWRAAAAPTPPHPRHLPWLLLIPYSNDSPRHVITPLDPHSQIYTLQTPSSLRMRLPIFGSSFGLFLVVDEATNTISIVNPLPGGRWSTLPPPLPFHRTHFLFLAKIGSVDPDLLVIVLGSSGAYTWRRGADEWSRIHVFDNGMEAEDIILAAGMYYIVDPWYTYVINSSTLELIHQFSSPQMANEYWYGEMHLVETSSGDVLLVIVAADASSSLLVYRLKGTSWEKATSIGEDTLFLDRESLTCFPTGRFGGYKSNCVYFLPRFSLPKMHVYDIATGEFESCEYVAGIGKHEAVWVSNIQ